MKLSIDAEKIIRRFELASVTKHMEKVYKISDNSGGVYEANPLQCCVIWSDVTDGVTVA